MLSVSTVLTWDPRHFLRSPSVHRKSIKKRNTQAEWVPALPLAGQTRPNSAPRSLTRVQLPTCYSLEEERHPPKEATTVPWKNGASGGREGRERPSDPAHAERNRGPIISTEQVMAPNSALLAPFFGFLTPPAEQESAETSQYRKVSLYSHHYQ